MKTDGNKGLPMGRPFCMLISQIPRPATQAHSSKDHGASLYAPTTAAINCSIVSDGCFTAISIL